MKKQIYILTGLILVLLSTGFTTVHSNIAVESPQTEILGFWVLEDDPSTKIEFLSNGQVKNYQNNVLESIDTYAITNLCDGHTAPNGQNYLKITFPEGDSFCYLINGINANNSGILSLLTMTQGKVVVYVRP